MTQFSHSGNLQISKYDSCNKRRPTNVATSSFFSRPLDQTRARFRSGESRPFCKKVLGLHRNQPAVLLSLPLTPSPPQHRRRRRRLASPPSCPPPAGPPASLRPSPPSSRYAPPLEPSTSRDVPAPREPVVAPSACRSRLAQRTAGSLCSSSARRPSAQRQKSGRAQLARCRRPDPGAWIPTSKCCVFPRPR